jgi:hypothetical protein
MLLLKIHWFSLQFMLLLFIFFNSIHAKNGNITFYGCFVNCLLDLASYETWLNIEMRAHGVHSSRTGVGRCWRLPSSFPRPRMSLDWVRCRTKIRGDSGVNKKGKSPFDMPPELLCILIFLL